MNITSSCHNLFHLQIKILNSDNFFKIKFKIKFCFECMLRVGISVGWMVIYVNSKMDEVSFERRDRVLLRPWLENMLENGSIPGLEWFDKDRMMFKVPWKHRSKKDWSLRHSSVFLVCNFTSV